ncbi:MAG TPA: helix-turn-helix transcriptional regulator [Clostridiaceae bacterium]|nr:helix-turn-helix transcriptional regulator [Clostridiaceae bacterium]
MGVNRVKVARICKNLTQDEVSKLLGVTISTYNRKELGLVDFKREEVLRLAKILDLTLQDVNEIFFNNKLTDMLNKNQTA